MEAIRNVLALVYFGNRVSAYLSAAAVILVGLLAVVAAQAVVRRRWPVPPERTGGPGGLLAQFVRRGLFPLLYFGAVYLGLSGLALSPPAARALERVAIALLTVVTIRSLLMLIEKVLVGYLARRGDDQALLDVSLRGLLPAIKVILWGFGLIFLLQNLGLNLSTVIAGLGVGGIAAALAAQAVLKDLFSYLAILFDRPFEIGDFIEVGDFRGTVEHVGIKTTRLRSLSGEEIIFSNTDLTESRVRNYKRMQERRVAYRLGVVYGTTHEQLAAIPGIVAGIVGRQSGARFDRAHFFGFADFSLVFEVVYYVLSGDYTRYMDLQQAINLEIKHAFEERGIEFAFPTQTLFVSGQIAASSTGSTGSAGAAMKQGEPPAA